MLRHGQCGEPLLSSHDLALPLSITSHYFFGFYTTICKSAHPHTPLECILRGFLKSKEFGLGGGQALRKAIEQAQPTDFGSDGPAPWRTDASILDWLEGL